MRYGARMTVRSSPSSKHVPRKERRYHVKNIEHKMCILIFYTRFFLNISHSIVNSDGYRHDVT